MLIAMEQKFLLHAAEIEDVLWISVVFLVAVSLSTWGDVIVYVQTRRGQTSICADRNQRSDGGSNNGTGYEIKNI